MAETILIIDDQENLRRLLKEYFSELGYRVLTAKDGQEGLFVARYENPDLILLDIMMPKLDGYQFLEAFRKESKAPVIVLTAKTEESDTIQGLELGADDYVVKPFRMRELAARVRVALRRLNPDAEPEEIIKIGSLSLNATSHSVTINNETVLLTPIEFDLLHTLMRAPGKVFTRAELVDRLNETGFMGLESTLNVHIRNLRSKVEKDPANPELITTVFGVGYRLNK